MGVPINNSLENEDYNNYDNNTFKENKTKYETRLNKIFNHTIHEEIIEKKEEVLQCYYQNIGGLPYSNNVVGLDCVQEIIRQYEFSLVGLSEINIDTTKHHLRQSIMDQIKKSEGQKSVVSTSEVVSKK